MLEHVRLEGLEHAQLEPGLSIAGLCPILSLLSVLVGVLRAFARMLFNSFRNDSSAASNVVGLEVLTEGVDASIEYAALIQYIWGND